jgi:putative phosphoribosyl transferase
MQTEELRDNRIAIPSGMSMLAGDLHVPASATALVVLACAGGAGCGDSLPLRQRLGDAGLATLLVDLMTADEAAADRRTGHVRFDQGLLGARMVAVVDWLGREAATASLALGLYGRGAAGPAAVLAAVRRPQRVRAAACHGGRLDLAGRVLQRLTVPLLVQVPADDRRLLQAAAVALKGVPAGTPVKLVDDVATSSLGCAPTDWFDHHLRAARSGGRDRPEAA